MKLQCMYDVIPVMIWTKKGRRYEAEMTTFTTKECAEQYIGHINNDDTDRYAEVLKVEKVYRVEDVEND